jgi:hypothetical protein
MDRQRVQSSVQLMGLWLENLASCATQVLERVSAVQEVIGKVDCNNIVTIDEQV